MIAMCSTVGYMTRSIMYLCYGTNYCQKVTLTK